MKKDMVRAYVETLLERLTGADKMSPDHDGDYPVRYRNSLYYVRLIGEVDPVVQVFATAVSDIPLSPDLCVRLNEINSDIRFARVFWVAEQVLVEADLVGSTLDPEEFDNACTAVAAITDRHADLLATRYGGATFFEDQKDETQDKATEPGHGTGLYL